MGKSRCDKADTFMVGLHSATSCRAYETAYMEQLTRSLTFTGPLVVLIQAPAEVLPVPSLKVSGPRKTVRRHCDCTANLAPIINSHTYLPTKEPLQITEAVFSQAGCSLPTPNQQWFNTEAEGSVRNKGVQERSDPPKVWGTHAKL